jgi:hypothetical protein
MRMPPARADFLMRPLFPFCTETERPRSLTRRVLLGSAMRENRADEQEIARKIDSD